MWSQEPTETVVNVQNFPGGACPHTPLVWEITTYYNLSPLHDE